ncbi:MAG: sigma-70 family RNA polymerase sigma factor [Dysosmobacter sp.]|nr:sigma-70 family RNA polymerase sigma factor [Dysosmobacter sp.]
MDKARFTAAARRYQNMVYRTALHALGSPQDADDAVQEVFLRLFRYQEPFDGEEHLRRWLLRRTVNYCRDVLKSPWRRRRVSWEEVPETPVFDRPEQAALYREVMALPEKYRTVLNLFYYEELSVREIGELLGLGASTVTTRLARARTRLRERLGEDWQDE